MNDNVIPFNSNVKRMVDANTLYSPNQCEDIENLSKDLIYFLDEVSPELAFSCSIVAICALIKNNPNSTFDINSLISLVNHILKTDICLSN